MATRSFKLQGATTNRRLAVSRGCLPGETHCAGPCRLEGQLANPLFLPQRSPGAGSTHPATPYGGACPRRRGLAFPAGASSPVLGVSISANPDGLRGSPAGLTRTLVSVCPSCSRPSERMGYNTHGRGELSPDLFPAPWDGISGDSRRLGFSRPCLRCQYDLDHGHLSVDIPPLFPRSGWSRYWHLRAM